jgi:hypothetical protein
MSRKRRADFDRFNDEYEPASALEFIATNPVFRLEELQAFYVRTGRKASAARPAIAYHLKTGGLQPIRRGLYGRRGSLDFWLVGSRVAPDAVLAYDAALSFHFLHTPGHRMCFLTATRATPFAWGDVIFTPVRLPRTYRGASELEDQVVTGGRMGLSLRVTSVERTLVDCADRLDLASHDPLALMDFFAQPPTLDYRQLVRRLNTLDSRVCAARVGLFLVARRDVPPFVEQHLERLLPREPTYLVSRHERGDDSRLLGRWNLIVPEAVYARWMKLGAGSSRAI